MRPRHLTIPLLFALLTACDVNVAERSDAISSIGAAVAAVDTDTLACRSKVRADLKRAEKRLGRGDKLRRATKVSDTLREIARDAKASCGDASVRAVRRARRDVGA